MTVTFTGEGPLDRGSSLRVSYDNRGEPYRTGISLWLDEDDRQSGCFLQEHEARKLAELINRLYPPRSK